jgi:hypothetical protein
VRYRGVGGGIHTFIISFLYELPSLHSSKGGGDNLHRCICNAKYFNRAIDIN